VSAKGMLGAMVAGSVLVVVAVSRLDSAPPPPTTPQRPYDVPWLTPDAAAQLIGVGGTLGPVFSDLELGGPAPSSIVRTRIAEFARANDVEIDLEVVDRRLAAVRFAVTFRGCCGYEGADVLALRLGRPKTQECCGCETGWIDDWVTVNEDRSIHMRARVRVNRVVIRWERALTLPELLDRADTLFDANATTVGNAARDRWTELEPGRRYLLEVPYQFARSDFGSAPRLKDRDDLGFQVVVDRGRITELSFSLRDLDPSFRAVLRSHWGRPRVEPQDVWTWRTPDRIVTADLDDGTATIAMRTR
jgi:hypothetical protein